MAFARVGFEVEASVSFPAPAASCKTSNCLKTPFLLNILIVNKLYLSPLLIHWFSVYLRYEVHYRKKSKPTRNVLSRRTH